MNEFYTEISRNHFWRIVNDNDRNSPLWSKFTIDEFNKLESLDQDPLHEEDAFTNEPESNRFILSFSTTHIENAESIEMDIYKTTDEWFYACVSIPSVSINYYKCDQFDGLLKLISSLDWNKLNESKLEEYYNKKINESKEYYTKITQGEYYNGPGKWIKLSDEEIYFLSKYRKDSSYSPWLIYRFIHDVEFVHSVGRYRLGEKATIGVGKIDDEWFYVYFESIENNYAEYYRCDQFDGVIKLLSDKLIKEVREMKHLKLFESFENELFVEIPHITTFLDTLD